MSAPLLVFDLGNVILEVHFERFCQTIARPCGRSPQEARDAFCDGPLKGALDRGRLGPWAFATAVSDWQGAEAMPHEVILEAWAQIFSPLPGAVEGLARCRAQHELWLLSDTDPIHFAHALGAFPEVRHFERYLLSYARGRLKRDPGAFDALGAVASAGRRVIFVDDLPVNVEAASAAGIDAILFEGWPALLGRLRSLGLLKPA